MIKYFVQLKGGEEREVTREEYISAERLAGFYPKMEGAVATASFGSLFISGRTVYEEDKEIFFRRSRGKIFNKVNKVIESA